MQIIPALLTQKSAEFENQLQRLSPYYTRFQVDIADGKFVPNTTLTVEEYISGIQTVGAIEKQFDFHLMVEDYKSDIRKLQSCTDQIKIGVIFIHTSLSPNYEQLTTNYPQFSFGLVLNQEDEVNTIVSKYDMSKIENIQIMTIVPGFQGQSFIPEMLEKIQQLRHNDYKANVFIDGSVNEKTLPTILGKEYKPDFLCIGSYLTKAEDLEERVNKLEELLSSRT